MSWPFLMSVGTATLTTNQLTACFIAATHDKMQYFVKAGQKHKLQTASQE